MALTTLTLCKKYFILLSIKYTLVCKVPLKYEYSELTILTVEYMMQFTYEMLSLCSCDQGHCYTIYGCIIFRVKIQVIQWL